MSLTGRFSALFLGALGLVLVVFSTVLYISARIYLDRRVSDRLDASLAVLAAAAEIHTDRSRVGAPGAGPSAGPGVRARAAALDGLRRSGPSHRSFAQPDRRRIDRGLGSSLRGRGVAVPLGGSAGPDLAGGSASSSPRCGRIIRLAASPRLARSRRTPIRPRCSIPRWS